MNFNLYIFGKNLGTYNQYPDDYTSSLLSSFCSDIHTSKAMIARDHDLVHYIFAENLGNENVIGICIIFNKAYVKRINDFFNFLRDLIETTLLRQGKIIRYNKNGNIEFSSNNLSDDVKSYEYVKALTDSKLESDNNYFGIEELTSIYNGIHNSETASANTLDSEILRLQEKYNRITIDYKIGIEDDLTKQVIGGLQKEICALNIKINVQSKEIARLEKTKKQFKKVIFLFVVLLCCCGGLYFLYTTLDETERNLNDTTEQLNTAIDSIGILNDVLVQKQDKIVSLKDEIRSERNKKEAAQDSLKNLKAKCPFLITSTSCNLSDRRYTVNYYANESGTRSFEIKVIRESSGRAYTKKSISEYIYSGDDSFTVYFNRTFNTSDWYIFEIWEGNRLIGGSRH